jgi:hypothetical protein
MGVAKLGGHEKLGGSCKGIFTFANNFLGILLFIFNSKGLNANKSIINKNVWRGVVYPHTKG